MDNTNSTLLQYFDLEDGSDEMQGEFLEELAETLFGSIVRKAWVEFDGDKKETFAKLLEESSDDPESVEKYTAVLTFLDEHIVNLRDFIEKELRELQKSYKTTRDELQDSLV